MLGETHDCYIAEYGRSTNRLYILGANVGSDTMPILQSGDDLVSPILPGISDTSRDGAANEGIMGHELTIAIRIWFVFVCNFLAKQEFIGT